MNIKMAFTMAIKSISSNKARSCLTMLGIVIGVCAVIMLVGIVQGATNSIKEQVEGMGTNLISVSVVPHGSTRSVEFEDMDGMADKYYKYIEAVAPVITGRVTIKNGTENITSTVTGTNEYYCSIRNREIDSGRFINQLDVDRRNKVAVIGSYQANELYGGTQNAVGQSIKVNGSIYTVVGVLDETSDSDEGSNDDTVIVPYTSAARLVKNATISSYMISAADSELVDGAVTVTKNYLNGLLGDEDLYTVISQKEIVETMDEMLGILTSMLAAIAGISLLVGGIGIMNIMLVSVTERTREIGIRKAIGAKRRSILSQFLIESIILSGMGGVVGIILGIGLGSVVGKMLNVTAAPSFGTVMGSFMFAVFVGVFFGWYPANKASKLNPIEALRFE